MLERYKDKKVYVRLKGHREYCGKVQFIEKDLIGIIDTKNRLVTFNKEEIKLIQEEK